LPKYSPMADALHGRSSRNTAPRSAGLPPIGTGRVQLVERDVDIIDANFAYEVAHALVSRVESASNNGRARHRTMKNQLFVTDSISVVVRSPRVCAGTSPGGMM